MTFTVENIALFLRGFKRKELTGQHLKKAAVLMLFYPKNEELHVLLTKRTEDVEHHKGQISFPGGSRDAADSDIVVTALRECEEEIGLPREVLTGPGNARRLRDSVGICHHPRRRFC